MTQDTIKNDIAQSIELLNRFIEEVKKKEEFKGYVIVIVEPLSRDDVYQIIMQDYNKVCSSAIDKKVVNMAKDYNELCNELMPAIKACKNFLDRNNKVYGE